MQLSTWNDKRFAVTGRVKMYLENPEKGTMPASCTVFKYNNDLVELVNYVDVALRTGAGINVILDGVNRESLVADKGKSQWSFVLSPSHKDYESIKSDPCASDYHGLPNWFFSGVYQELVVADSMEEDIDGAVSIKKSWEIFFENCKLSIPTNLHLSNLRPRDSINTTGLAASGPLSFLKIYKAIADYVDSPSLLTLMNVASSMCDVLRRGGHYKNGAISYSMDYQNPLIHEFLNIELKDISGSGKKGVRVDSGILRNPDLMAEVVKQVNKKALYLEKKFGDLYSNLCREILISSRGSCLLAHVNLGQCTLEKGDITEAFVKLTRLLCELARNYKRHPQYLPFEQDKQIGVGVIGLANLLSINNISYSDFTHALFGIAHTSGEVLKSVANGDAIRLANELYTAHHEAAKVAREYGMDRAFTIAPTQTCAYNHQDAFGFTCTKNINPPLNRIVRRRSHTVDSMNKIYNHGNVETVQSVIKTDSSTIQDLWESWQIMIDSTGLAHSMSFDLYWKIDQNWLQDFIEVSPLKTVYYNLYDLVDTSYLNKSVVQIAGESSCAIDNPEGCIGCGE